MDQDGNTAMPQKPDFSSQNAPTNPEVAAAAAAMTESDPKQAIMSTPSASASAQAHGMFGNRRFKAKNDATPTSFAGAPDFFNQAASGSNSSDFITVGGDASAPKASNKKLFIIGGCLLGALAIVLVATLFIPGVNKSIQESAAKKADKETWTRIGNFFLTGEEKDDDISDKTGEIRKKIIWSDIDYYDKGVEYLLGFIDNKDTKPELSEELAIIRDKLLAFQLRKRLLSINSSELFSYIDKSDDYVASEIASNSYYDETNEYEKQIFENEIILIQQKLLDLRGFNESGCVESTGRIIPDCDMRADVIRADSELRNGVERTARNVVSIMADEIIGTIKEHI